MRIEVNTLQSRNFQQAPFISASILFGRVRAISRPLPLLGIISSLAFLTLPSICLASPTPTTPILNVPDFLINTYTAGNQGEPVVANLTDGGFVTVWYGEGAGDTMGIFGQRYFANGSRFGREFRINTYTTNDQILPSASGLVGGGFVVAWEGEGVGDNEGIFGQLYFENGTAFGQEFRANSYTANTQDYSSVAGLLDGGFVVTWWGEGSSDSNGIFAQVNCLLA